MHSDNTGNDAIGKSLNVTSVHEEIISLINKYKDGISSEG